MDIKEKTQRLQSVLDKAVDQKKIFGTAFSVRTDQFVWHGVSGDLQPSQNFFIGSVTKLFTTALILILRSQQRLELDDTLLSFMPHAPIRDLHIYRGKNYTHELSLRHLLSHTSGLPDYFADKNEAAKSFQDLLLRGNDRRLSFDDIMEMVKSLPPHFAPGTPGRAQYSDSNFQLLGKVIENVTSMPFAQACLEFIILPLGLSHTYVYANTATQVPKAMYYKKQELHIPQAMITAGADGGMVSNSGDLLDFAEAFFTGKLFPLSYLQELQVWNKIFFPMASGVGIHLFKLPWILNPAGAIPAFMGHSGLSGALAYYCPLKNFYITGTVNQIDNPDISIRTMIKLAQVLIKK